MHPIFKVSARVSPIFRRRRMAKFLEMFKPSIHTQILDVGGLPRFWDGVPITAQITLVNLDPLDEYEGSFLRPNMRFAQGDGTHLPFPDQSFDIVFSNSVIEHLGTEEQQRAFAQECCRVGRGHWVQTPARECVMEPHYFGLCVHWFSKPVQRRLLPYFSLWGLLRRPSPETLDYVLAELRLLSGREFRGLFPQSRIWVERLLGMPKSYTAYQLPAASVKKAPTPDLAKQYE